MIDLLKTHKNLRIESEDIYMWLKDKPLVLRSLLALTEQLKNHGLPYVLVLNLEGIHTSPTFLTVTLMNDLACSDKDRVLNLITLYRDTEELEEVVNLFETLKAYTPLVSVLHTYSQGKRSLVVYYNELLNGIVTFDYYDYSVRLVHNSKSLLSNVMVSTYSDSANYFELKTQSAQGNTLSFQLSVDEQTELTVTSKRDFVPLKDLTKVVDSIFSDISQYMDESLTLT